jgi:hypothetical protein
VVDLVEVAVMIVLVEVVVGLVAVALQAVGDVI